MRDDTAFMDRIHAYLPGLGRPEARSRRYFTDHFGLVSDFLSECWTPAARRRRRLRAIQGRVTTRRRAERPRHRRRSTRRVDGLLKLLYPDAEAPIADEDLEWAVRLALECRRRVKEQQKRIGRAEFRNTHFSYRIGEDGVEQFVATPELRATTRSAPTRCRPGRSGRSARAAATRAPGLYRIEVDRGARVGREGSSTRPAPAPFRESFKVAEQNLIAQARALVGDRDPREHEFTVQLRALDAAKSGAGLGLPILLALASAMLQRSVRGGLIAVGNLTLGGGVETVLNAAALAEHAMEKGARRCCSRSPLAASCSTSATRSRRRSRSSSTATPRMRS